MPNIVKMWLIMRLVFPSKNECLWGQRLKSKGHEYNPFWKSFYGRKDKEIIENEFIPKTPVHLGQIVPCDEDESNPQKQPKSSQKEKGKCKFIRENWSIMHKSVQPDRVYSIASMDHLENKFENRTGENQSGSEIQVKNHLDRLWNRFYQLSHDNKK